MITKALLELIVALFTALTYLLPDYTPPPAVDLSAFQVISWLVPINELITLASAFVAFVIATLSYVGINWVIKKGRGSG